VANGAGKLSSRVRGAAGELLDHAASLKQTTSRFGAQLKAAQAVRPSDAGRCTSGPAFLTGRQRVATTIPCWN